MPKCKECKKEVETENYDDESQTCNECLFYIDELYRTSPRMVQVTRDMAINAGDINLEGLLIEW